MEGYLLDIFDCPEKKEYILNFVGRVFYECCGICNKSKVRCSQSLISGFKCDDFLCECIAYKFWYNKKEYLLCKKHLMKCSDHSSLCPFQINRATKQWWVCRNYLFCGYKTCNGDSNKVWCNECKKALPKPFTQILSDVISGCDLFDENIVNIIDSYY